MPTHQRDIKAIKCGLHILEQLCHLRFRRSDWQEKNGEKPPGANPHHGNIVGIDHDSMPADLSPGQGNGIGGRDERTALDVDNSSVFADRRREKHIG